MTQDALASKKESLEGLEKSEAEARRLETALSASTTLGRAGSRRSILAGEDPDEEDAATTPTTNSPQGPTIPPPRPPPPPTAPMQRRRTGSGGGMGFLSALSYSLHGMMDVDPEASRRNSISKSRETISQVRKAAFTRLAEL